MLSSKYGPGAPEEIFSGRFTKLTEVSLFYYRLSLSPGFTLDLLPPHATTLPLSLPFSLLSTSLVSCTLVHKSLGSISIHSETVLVNPSCTGAWKLPQEVRWAMSVLISSVFLVSVLPDVQDPKSVSYILSRFLVVRSTLPLTVKKK